MTILQVCFRLCRHFTVFPVKGLFIILLCVGCSGEGSGVDRYEIQGNVTFNNEPVPAGQIIFEPDTKNGGQGPAAIAEIKNGQYQIPENKGIVGGPHVVRIIGYKGIAMGDSEVDGGGEMLFPEYSKPVKLEKKNSILDVLVPVDSRHGPKS